MSRTSIREVDTSAFPQLKGWRVVELRGYCASHLEPGYTMLRVDGGRLTGPFISSDSHVSMGVRDDVVLIGLVPAGKPDSFMDFYVAYLNLTLDKTLRVLEPDSSLIRVINSLGDLAQSNRKAFLADATTVIHRTIQVDQVMASTKQACLDKKQDPSQIHLFDRSMHGTLLPLEYHFRSAWPMGIGLFVALMCIS